MTTATGQTADVPVRKSVTVNAGIERAFHVFTEGFDTWWPRGHHIGESPLVRAVIETKLGGRCYGRSADGTDSVWGRIFVWDPPRRFAFAWLIDGEWKHQPDPAKASEVEVVFTEVSSGVTRVDLEHRRFDRMVSGGEGMRAGVDAEGGWGTLLQLFAKAAEA